MKHEKFNVLIIENSEIILKNLEEMIESIDCMKIVGIANNANDALKMINELTPRCIVIDKIKTKENNPELLDSIEKQANLVIVDIDKLNDFL
jgi:chemotaxis response regulator CheB